MYDHLMRVQAGLLPLFLLALFWPFEFGSFWRPAVLLVLVALLWAAMLLSLLAALWEAPFWSAAIAFARRKISAGRQIAQPETDEQGLLP
jgi:hypothetical protein